MLFYNTFNYILTLSAYPVIEMETEIWEIQQNGANESQAIL